MSSVLQTFHADKTQASDIQSITISKHKTLKPQNVKDSKRKIEKELTTFEGHIN